MNKLHKMSLLALALAPLTAHAGVTLLTGNNPLPNSQNILFNGPGSISGPALLVAGLTNSTGDRIDFFGAGKNLVTPSSGQARVEADQGTFSALTIKANSPTAGFEGMVFNVNAATNGVMNVVVHGADGDYTFLGNAISNSGSNFYTIVATPVSKFNSVDFTFTADVEDYRQIRVNMGNPVPEPASLSLLGLGVAALARRRKA